MEGRLEAHVLQYLLSTKQTPGRSSHFFIGIMHKIFKLSLSKFMPT